MYQKNLGINSTLSSRPDGHNRWRIWFATTVLGIVVMALVSEPTYGAVKSEPSPFASVEKRLVQAGFNAKEIGALYERPELSFDYKGITAYFTHREATLNYDQFLSRSSIKKAKSYKKQHKKALEQARQRYGVEEEIITAILLVESRLGTYRGKRLIINTLSNLSAIGDPAVRDMLWETHVSKKAPGKKAEFDKWSARKSKWAFKELQAYLKYVKAEDVDPFSMRGSLAGALGFSQFVPSSVLNYGKDGNDDGKINLYQHPDAIESIANYLKKHGWKPGLSRDKAFKIILRYNNSKYYANTILDVADRIAAK